MQNQSEVNLSQLINQSDQLSYFCFSKQCIDADKKKQQQPLAYESTHVLRSEKQYQQCKNKHPSLIFSLQEFSDYHQRVNKEEVQSIYSSLAFFFNKFNHLFLTCYDSALNVFAFYQHHNSNDIQEVSQWLNTHFSFDKGRHLLSFQNQKIANDLTEQIRSMDSQLQNLQSIVEQLNRTQYPSIRMKGGEEKVNQSSQIRQLDQQVQNTPNDQQNNNILTQQQLMPQNQIESSESNLNISQQQNINSARLHSNTNNNDYSQFSESSIKKVKQDPHNSYLNQQSELKVKVESIMNKNEDNLINSTSYNQNYNQDLENTSFSVSTKQNVPNQNLKQNYLESNENSMNLTHIDQSNNNSLFLETPTPATAKKQKFVEPKPRRGAAKKIEKDDGYKQMKIQNFCVSRNTIQKKEEAMIGNDDEIDYYNQNNNIHHQKKDNLSNESVDIDLTIEIENNNNDNNNSYYNDNNNSYNNQNLYDNKQLFKLKDELKTHFQNKKREIMIHADDKQIFLSSGESLSSLEINQMESENVQKLVKKQETDIKKLCYCVINDENDAQNNSKLIVFSIANNNKVYMTARKDKQKTQLLSINQIQNIETIELMSCVYCPIEKKIILIINRANYNFQIYKISLETEIIELIKDVCIEDKEMNCTYVNYNMICDVDLESNTLRIFIYDFTTLVCLQFYSNDLHLTKKYLLNEGISFVKSITFNKQPEVYFGLSDSTIWKLKSGSLSKLRVVLQSDTKQGIPLDCIVTSNQLLAFVYQTGIFYYNPNPKNRSSSFQEIPNCQGAINSKNQLLVQKGKYSFKYYDYQNPKLEIDLS